MILSDRDIKDFIKKKNLVLFIVSVSLSFLVVLINILTNKITSKDMFELGFKLFILSFSSLTFNVEGILAMPELFRSSYDLIFNFLISVLIISGATGFFAGILNKKNRIKVMLKMFSLTFFAPVIIILFIYFISNILFLILLSIQCNGTCSM